MDALGGGRILHAVDPTGCGVSVEQFRGFRSGALSAPVDCEEPPLRGDRLVGDSSIRDQSHNVCAMDLTRQ